MAQEQQLSVDNVLNAENAGNIFQSWIKVKRKKHKRRALNGFHAESKNVSDFNQLVDLVNHDDYRLNIMSKKRIKQHRDRDEDLAKSLSLLSTNMGLQSATSDGVQSSSKTIKKKERSKKKRHGRKGRDIEEVKQSGEEHRSKEQTNKRNGNETEFNIDSFSTSDDEEKSHRTDPLVSQIRNVMSQYPSKRFKVKADELTPYQKRHLQKSGLRIELQSVKRPKRKTHKERAQFEKLIKKIEKSMDFSASNN